MKKVVFGLLFAVSTLLSVQAQQGSIHMNGGSASNTSLRYAADIGYLFGNVDVSARYQGLTQSGENLSFIGLGIGYSFGIRKF